MNVELAKRVLQTIRKKPKEWNQGEFIEVTECGTAQCFAGWACILSGYQAKVQEYFAGFKWAFITDSLGQPISIPDVAQRLLDIDFQQADALFHGSNTLSDLEELVERFSQPDYDWPDDDLR